jgi:hypothetical protein
MALPFILQLGLSLVTCYLPAFSSLHQKKNRFSIWRPYEFVYETYNSPVFFKFTIQITPTTVILMPYASVSYYTPSPSKTSEFGNNMNSGHGKNKHKVPCTLLLPPLGVPSITTGTYHLHSRSLASSYSWLITDASGRVVSRVGSVGGGVGKRQFSLVLTNTSKHCTCSRYLVYSNIKEFSDSQRLYHWEIFVNTTHCIIQLTSYTKAVRLKIVLVTTRTTCLPFLAADRLLHRTDKLKNTWKHHDDKIQIQESILLTENLVICTHYPVLYGA